MAIKQLFIIAQENIDEVPNEIFVLET